MLTGLATLVSANDERQEVRLRLTEDTLYIDKQELAYTYVPSGLIDPAILSKERKVYIKRDKPGGLGLSVKGGAEHSLPVLVSRIFKDQAADRTGQLFVGDAILEVNGENVEAFCHDEAVRVLKNAGDDVVLTVRYFEPASGFLSLKNKKHQRNSVRDGTISSTSSTVEENGNTAYEPERQWTSLVTLPLLCAYVTRYRLDSSTISADCIDVSSVDSSTVYCIQFDTQRVCDDWMRSIQRNITAQNNLSIALTNGLLLSPEHVIYMSWVCEWTNSSHWKKIFLSLKGADVFLYETPPVKTRDWVKCEKSGKIYECMFKILKGSELVSGRPNGFQINTADGSTHLLSMETREELLQLEKAWYKATYTAVKQITNLTFGCTCNGHLCGLTLDLNKGFCLYNSQTKACVWSYKFSQLKHSSDDSKTCLRLQFHNDMTNQLDTWELECTELRTLLYSLHAFLSAKLASVDPIFLLNI